MVFTQGDRGGQSGLEQCVPRKPPAYIALSLIWTSGDDSGCYHSPLLVVNYLFHAYVRIPEVG